MHNQCLLNYATIKRFPYTVKSRCGQSRCGTFSAHPFHAVFRPRRTSCPSPPLLNPTNSRRARSAAGPAQQRRPAQPHGQALRVGRVGILAHHVLCPNLRPGPGLPCDQRARHGPALLLLQPRGGLPRRPVLQLRWRPLCGRQRWVLPRYLLPRLRGHAPLLTAERHRSAADGGSWHE